MFAIQFGYSAWDSGPWGFLLLAVQIAVGLVVGPHEVVQLVS